MPHIIDFLPLTTAVIPIDRHSDERVQDIAADVVAPQDLRLTRVFPLNAVTIVGAVLLWFLVVPLFTAILDAFAR